MTDSQPAPTSTVDHDRIEAAVKEILSAVGEDPQRDGLIKTPGRVARMYAEVMSGLALDPARHLEVTFAACPTLYDGRYRNNAWMQECPDPTTKLTWDNAAVMSRGTAEALSVGNGDMVELTVSFLM